MKNELKKYIAVDIGASGGRHIVGWTENGVLRTEEAYRFANGMEERNGCLLWDIDRLYNEVLEGAKRSLSKHPGITSMAIDTWGVDYALIGKDGGAVLPVHAYRDARNAAAAEAVHKIIPAREIYARCGI
ncbi:MAG: rhamnulokinase, partial [Firmicutes bacterium]|nr:rhamnulokinase [Bacillota bacterium]